MTEAGDTRSSPARLGVISTTWDTREEAASEAKEGRKVPLSCTRKRDVGKERSFREIWVAGLVFFIWGMQGWEGWVGRWLDRGN